MCLQRVDVSYLLSHLLHSSQTQNILKLLFTLVGPFRRSVELPVILFMLLLTNSVPLICFFIIALKLWHAHACASIDIKFLYWYRDSKFHIDILVYRYISLIPSVCVYVNVHLWVYLPRYRYYNFSVMYGSSLLPCTD